ncbi:MAG TPA: GAF domain-containing protein, partial [Anaerolineae bacterium]|nr:GAF domain-containing protein [Anaerolineae bacterium]
MKRSKPPAVTHSRSMKNTILDPVARRDPVPAQSESSAPIAPLIPIEWAGVLDRLPGTVFVLDHSGIILWVNSSITSASGYTREALLGRTLLELLIENEHERFDQWFNAVLTAQPAAHIEPLTLNTYLRRFDDLIDYGCLSGVYDTARQNIVVTYHRLNVRKELDASLQERITRLEVANAAATIVSQSLDPDKALQAVLQKTLEVLHAEAGIIMLLDPDSGDLVFKAQIGWRPYALIDATTRVKANIGLAGVVVQTEVPVVVDDVLADPRISISGFRQSGVRSIALVPMHSRAKVIGVLSVIEYSPRSFVTEDVNILCTIADQIGISIENAQLYQSEQKQRRLAEALHQVAGVVNSTLNLDTVLDLIVDQLKRVVSYDSVSLWLSTGGDFQLAITRGDVDWTLANAQFSKLRTTQLLLEKQEPIIILDTTADSIWIPLVKDDPVRSWLGIPLLNKNNDQVLGILEIDNYKPYAYSKEDIQAAVVFATQAAAAIENARLYAESQRRAELMAALNSVSATVSQSLELEPTLRSALDKALEVVGVEAGAISLVDEETQELVIRVHRGWRQQDLLSGLRIKLGQGLSGQAALTGEVVVTGSLENEPRLAVPAVRDEGVQSMVLAPMHARGRVVGVLGVMSYRVRMFDRQSIEVVKSIADQIGLAIDNAQLFARESRRAVQLALLNDVARDVVSTPDLMERLNKTTQVIREKFGYFSVLLFMVDEDGQHLSMRSGAGEQANLVDPNYHQPMGKGLIGSVAQSGEMIMANDVANDPRYLNPLPDRADPVKAELAVPLRLGQQVVGVLDIQQLQINAFTRDDAQVIQSLADQLVVAITNAQLYDQACQRVTELTALQQISLQVTSSLDLWTVLEAITHSVLTLIHAATAHIYLFNADSNELTFSTALWDDNERAAAVLQPQVDDPISQVARTGKLVIDNDRSMHPWGTPPLALGALAALPLKRADRVVGVLLTAFRSPHYFVPDQVRVLMLLADQAAVAIDHARLYTNESRRSTHLSLINAVGRQATSTLDLTTLLDRASAAIRQSFGYFHVGLLLLDKAANEVLLHAYSGGSPEAYGLGYRQSIDIGLIGWAAKHGETMLANDVTHEPRYFSEGHHPKTIHAELCVPIIRNEEVIGVLNVEDLEFNAFSPDDVRAMETLADQLAIAIENARLYEEANQRVAELAALQEISLQVTASLDTLSVLNTIAQNTLLLIRADDIHIFLYDPDTDSMMFGTALWKDGSREPAIVQPRRNGLTWKVFQEGQPVVINDAQHHPLYDTDQARAWGLTSIAGFPLKRADAILGVFNVAFKEPHTFSPEEIRVIMLLSDLAAIAVSNARLYEQTKRRLDEISTLHEVSVAATSTLDFGEVTERTVRALQRSLGFEYIALFLVDEDDQHADLYSTSGREAEVERNPRVEVGVGIIGWVIANGKLLNVPDVLDDQRYLAGITTTRSEMCVPLRVGDRVIGAVDLQSPRLSAFSNNDERLLLTVAGQWAVILENARLYAVERRRRQQLEGLQVTASAIGAELDLNALLNLIVESAASTFSASAVSLLLWSESDKLLNIYASHGLSAEFVAETSVSYTEVKWALDPTQTADGSGDHTSAPNLKPLVIYDLCNNLFDAGQSPLY